MHERLFPVFSFAKKKGMKKIAIVLLLAITSIASKAQDIIIATYQYADNNRIANIQPLADHINKTLGLNVQVKSYPTVHEFIAGIQNNEVDIALINTFGYFLLQTSSKKYAMQPTAVLKIQAAAQDNYKTAIISLPGYAADTLMQLKKQAAFSKLNLVAVGSTSGNLVPRLALNAVGIKNPEKEFLSFAYGKNHKATLDAVLNNKADVAAIGSSEYFNFIQQPANAGKLKLLWLSPEIPLGPVLLHNRLELQVKDSLLSMLLQLHEVNNNALLAVKNGWSEAKQAEKFIAIKDDYYSPFRKQLGNKKAMTKILEQFAN